MFGLLSQNSVTPLMALENVNGDRSGGGGGGGNNAIVSSVETPNFDFDLSQIQSATAKGNTAADIRSAYEVFLTGYSSGRGYGYAQDILRRFSPGLTATYGVANIRTAAANYLDSAGLPRLANVVSGKESTDTTKPPDTPQKNPFEVLADAFSKAFGNAVYNPPLQQQTYGYTPSELSTPLTQTGGGGIGLYVILAIVAIIGYFLYKRFAS